MRAQKLLLLASLVAFLALAGCTQGSSGLPLEDKVRALPPVRDALAQVPNADLIVASWNEDTVSAVKKDLDAECGKAMEIKNYYRVQVTGKTTEIVLYLDPDTGEVVCRHAKGEVKPAAGPEYVPSDTEKPKPKPPPGPTKFFLEVFDAGGSPVRELPVRVERLVCDDKQVCVPKTVVDAKTDLVGRIKDLDAAVFSNSTLFAAGYHTFNSDGFIKLKQGYRALLQPVVQDKDVLPLKVKLFEAESGANFVGGTLTLRFDENATGILKQISKDGELMVTAEDFAAAGRKLVDEYGNLLAPQLFFDVDGIQEKGVLTALKKPFFMQSKEYTFGAFETQTATHDWDLRSKEVILRLHRTLPNDADAVVYAFDVKQGSNFISLPLKVADGYSAENFLSDISKQGPSCKTVSVYEVQAWATHDLGSLGSNFAMKNGVGYRLDCDAAATFHMKGYHVYDPVNVNLNLGFNYVGTTAAMEGKPINSLIMGCSSKGVQKYFPNGGLGLIASDSPAEIGQVYVLSCFLNGVWDGVA